MSADPKVLAVMSIPRLGWNDMWGAAIDVLGELKIPMLRTTGVFGEQCLTRAIEQAIEAGATHILTLDYDSVFSARDAATLLHLAFEHPHADAIAALQVSRGGNHTPLFSIQRDGEHVAYLDQSELQQDLVPVSTAHFGLTVFRADAFADLPKPWLHGQPAPDGGWGDGRIDPDIYFWRNWERAGRTAYLAPRAVIGHLEVMIRWPGKDLQPIWQHPSALKQSGIPDDAWR
jgi:hypothetical protein